MSDSSSLNNRFRDLQESIDEQSAQISRIGRRVTLFSIMGLASLGLVALLVIALLAIVRPTTSGHHSKSSNIGDSADAKELFWLLCHDGATTEERSNAFVNLLREGNTVWTSARLDGLSLPGHDFFGAHLRRSNLEGGNFKGANFSKANLDSSSLALTILDEANLSEATMIEAYLHKATMNQANFKNVNLTGAVLDQIVAHSVDFSGGNLSGTNFQLADLSESNLSRCDLSYANLDAAILRGADLEGTDLTGTLMEDIDLTDSNWWRADGIPLDLQDWFAAAFVPSRNADRSRREDFDHWAEERLEAMRKSGTGVTSDDTSETADDGQPAGETEADK